jgi:hypothetical protein
MVGGNTPQNLDFTSPVAGHGIRTLQFSCTSAKTITGAPTVTNYLLNNSSSPIVGPATVTVMGPELNANSQLWGVANTVVNSSTSLRLNGSSFSTNLTITGGTVQLENDGFTQLTGNVTVTGASSLLDNNGCEFFVTGDFLTTSGGRLRMADPNDLDYLTISGNATFACGGTTGLFTNGYLQVGGNFTQSGGATDAFAASEAAWVVRRVAELQGWPQPGWLDDDTGNEGGRSDPGGRSGREDEKARPKPH